MCREQFSQCDFNRYVRQMAVPDIGKDGQKNLLSSSVLIIGCGALGSMAAMQLAGAGIGKITVCDFDTIDISNLQRQFFFKTDETGKLKAEVLATRLQDLNPGIEINAIKRMITRQLAMEIFPEFDFVIDATDNPDSKRVTGEIAKLTGKPCCIAGVSDFAGQITTYMPDDPRFEDYFGNVTSGGFLPCSLGGVVGPAAALAASVQASEAIKYLAPSGETLCGKIFLFNLLDNSFRIFRLQ